MNNKSKKVGYTLAFFLGGIGAHAFYYRKYVKGSVYLLLSWTFVPILLGWVDLFFIKAWHNKIENNTLVQKNNLNQKATKGNHVKKETNKITMDDLAIKKRLDKESVLFSDGRPLKPLAKETLKREERKNVKQIVYAAIEEQQRVDYTLKSETVIKPEKVQNITSPIVSPENTISSHVEKRNEMEETVTPTPEGDLVARYTAARKNKTRLKDEEATRQPQETPEYPFKEIQEVVSTLKQVQQLQLAKTALPLPTEDTHSEEQIIADIQTVPSTMDNNPSLLPQLEEVVVDEVIVNVEVDILEAINTKVNEAAAVTEVYMEAEGKQEVVETVDVDEEESILTELTHSSSSEEPSVNIDPVGQPKNGLLLQASKLKCKIEQSLKNMPDYNVAKPSNHFYNEDVVILDKYRQIETPREILEAIERIRRGSSSKNNNSYGVSFSHNGSRFVKHSLDYATKRGVKCPEAPLHAYWTTFDSLHEKQEKWYFYWREQVLNGKYPDVDLSYIILFVYELLNYSFNQKAAFNISMMVRLHDNYAERLPKVKTYIGNWTADMLREVGENDLLEEWTSSSEVYILPLYKQLTDKKDELARISFTTWKPYIQNYKETVFFITHKHKIYRIFKESFPLLQEVYQKQGVQLIDRYFNMQEERTVKNLYNSAVMGRETDAFHVQTKRIQPTARINDEVTALFRLTENVTRLLNGEKRQIKVEESFLPEGFKGMMLEHFTPVAKETTKRFKVVQKAENLEGYGNIPPPPKENPVPEQRPVIEFNSANIKTFQAETEELIAIFNARSTEEEEIPGSADNVDTGTGPSYLGGTTGTPRETNIDTSNAGTNNEEVDATRKGNALISDLITKIETTMHTGDTSTPSDIYLALEGGGSIDGEEDFIESLTAIEKEFLVQFDNGVYNRTVANSFLKQKGIMLGVFISEINEKANEFLGDNFLESQDEEIAVYEEFEQCIITLKGTE
ncbi:TerB N-terminal domain-containing protein [Psychrobacillus psychrotolerans]|uniref:TerB N-terminal domain-containing protein n=1 Tax=Psychrobacillus psychrotolerans TaxID=126156 RepID=UPI0033155590